MAEGANDERGLFPATVGEQLADERRRQSLELSDVAARTRIPLRHLEAIEAGDHESLPALPYSAGFVKSYANMLGLDGQALSRAFRDQVGEARRAHFEPEAYEPVDPSRVPSRLLAMIALGIALLLGMGYLLLRFENDNTDLARLAADTVPDERPLAPKVVVPPPAPAPVVAEPAVPTGPIVLDAAEDVWIKVSEADGSRTYFMDMLRGGSSFTVPDDAVAPVLRTGRPQVIKLLIGSTELPPVGKPDQVVRAFSLKRDDLVAIATAKPGETPVAADAAANAAEPLAEPRRPRRVRQAPLESDPTGSRPDSSEPVVEPDQRP